MFEMNDDPKFCLGVPRAPDCEAIECWRRCRGCSLGAMPLMILKQTDNNSCADLNRRTSTMFPSGCRFGSLSISTTTLLTKFENFLTGCLSRLLVVGFREIQSDFSPPTRLYTYLQHSPFDLERPRRNSLATFEVRCITCRRAVRLPRLVGHGMTEEDA